MDIILWNLMWKNIFQCFLFLYLLFISFNWSYYFLLTYTERPDQIAGEEKGGALGGDCWRQWQTVQDWPGLWSAWNYKLEDLKRRAETLFLFLRDSWIIMLQPPAFPEGQNFRREKELWAQPRIGWPGWGWQCCSSLGVLEGSGSEAEPCHFSKILYLTLF